MHLNHFVAAAVLATGAAWAQNIPVSGGGSLNALIASEDLVTIVLKERGAKDRNVRIVEVQPGYIAVMTDSGERTAYTTDSISEIIVQDEKVDQSERFNVQTSRALRGEEQQVVDNAQSRALEIYTTAADRQDIRLRAAAIVGMTNNAEVQTYLDQLIATNDLPTQVEAAYARFLAGREVPEDIVRAGLSSPNLSARGMSIELAGMAAIEGTTSSLLRYAQDLSAELAAPAAVALARLGVRDVIPTLLSMIQETNEIKSDAAVWSLIELGGEEVIEQMKIRVKDASGLTRFKISKVLYGLEDPMGQRLLKEAIENTPTLAFEASILLARKGDWDAGQYLRARLERREGTNTESRVERARAAAALVEGGDPSALSVLQDLLRSDDGAVRMKVARLMVEIGQRRLLNVIHPSIASGDNEVAIEACLTAMALANHEFRERLLASRVLPRRNG